ncbi:polyprotein [Aspergillus luchuensis IFO 4308]|nr:polyprotein [Aspergillus luchuensis IFO 4308]
MKQPTGFHEGPPERVCLLKIALYGLRQAVHLWHRTFDEKLQEIGFKPLLEDPCVYRNNETWLIIYVDDSAIAGSEQANLTSVKHHLNEAFGLKGLGEPKVLLGCNILRDYKARSISLAQPTYLDECLAAAGKQSCSGVATPMTPTYTKADRTTILTDEVDINKYQSLVGRLNWLTTKTRPDLRHATFRLQRRMHAPTTADAKALKHIYRYLRTTTPYGIILAADHTKGIEVYMDAAHADHEDGKSTEGFIIFYAGGPISWSSNKQSVVAPSSTVAEFCAYDAAAKDALYVKTLYVMRNTFVDLTKYGTCLHNALVYEQEAKDKASRDLAEVYCELLVVAVPNHGNRRYIAFLALPQDCETRLQPDDHLTPHPAMEPRDRHNDLPADQEPNVNPFKTLIDVVSARKLLASIQPQQVVVHLVS